MQVHQISPPIHPKPVYQPIVLLPARLSILCILTNLRTEPDTHFIDLLSVRLHTITEPTGRLTPVNPFIIPVREFSIRMKWSLSGCCSPQITLSAVIPSNAARSFSSLPTVPALPATPVRTAQANRPYTGTRINGKRFHSHTLIAFGINSGQCKCQRLTFHFFR